MSTLPFRYIGLTLAIAAAPPLAAQVADTARATLLQLSLANTDGADADARRTALAEESARITSCSGAVDAVGRLKARGLHGEATITIRTNFALASLPPQLRATLAARPVGRATPVYGGSTAFRVLIRCEPSFRLPVTPPASVASPATI